MADFTVVRDAGGRALFSAKASFTLTQNADISVGFTVPKNVSDFMLFDCWMDIGVFATLAAPTAGFSPAMEIQVRDTGNNIVDAVAWPIQLFQSGMSSKILVGSVVPVNPVLIRGSDTLYFYGPGLESSVAPTAFMTAIFHGRRLRNLGGDVG